MLEFKGIKTILELNKLSLPLISDILFLDLETLF